MTVIKPKPKIAHPSSGNSSDADSLHIGGSVSCSDTESISNGPVVVTNVSRKSRISPNYIEELLILKKTSGKRKKRRYHNRTTLQTLAEEDDESPFVIMEPYKGPFARLLCDNNLLELWNKFIEKTEDEQRRIICGPESTVDERDVEKTTTVLRIPQRVRRTIKCKEFSLKHLQEAEQLLIDFFCNTPMQVYVQYPPTYLQRLLLHCTASYHGLKSLCLMEDDRRRIEVYNYSKEWSPAEEYLSKLVSRLKIH